MEKYIKSIFKVGQLAPESLIMGVVHFALRLHLILKAYVERIMSSSSFELFPFNWKRIILAVLMLASKGIFSLFIHSLMEQFGKTKLFGMWTFLKCFLWQLLKI